tara:strand:+ start:732 stop:1007 length:276 start_codon:yes stop_codon:yes gene_type:complete
MNEKILKYIVYFLGFLIIVAFFIVIYGIYINISNKSSINYNQDSLISLSLIQKNKIKNIQIIDKNRILFTIDNDNKIQNIIFDTDKQKIIK